MYQLSVFKYNRYGVFETHASYTKLGFNLLTRMVKSIANEAMAEGGYIRTIIHTYGEQTVEEVRAEREDYRRRLARKATKQN